MKKLKLFLAAASFTLALSVTGMAGDISCGITSTPPPTQQSQTASCGDISCGVVSTDGATSNEPTITEVALGLVQNVLALF